MVVLKVRARKFAQIATSMAILLLSVQLQVSSFDSMQVAGTRYVSKEDTAEEGDDGADDVPFDPNAALPSAEELRKIYVLQEEKAAVVSAFNPPKLPDLKKFNLQAIVAKIDSSKQGQISIGPLLTEPGFKALTTAIGQGLTEFSKRQRGGLRGIFVENGHVTMAQMAATLPKEVFEEIAPGIYVARLPILVRHGASLLIGKTVKQLRLSQERGALLANEGTLFVLSTEIVGWSEIAKAPSRFKTPSEYRPFIVGWGGSKTYIAQSRIANMGYASTKAYGLTFSQYSNSMIQRNVWPKPTGWILDSEIEDMWYGFYTWEADDVVLRGNTLKNNILYGFDPHDRSRRLIIAENEVYGTRKKHGIIISRNVDDSWIIGNKTHDNALSGIVLDRQCSNTVIANNIAYKNGADGIVISESSKNLLWNNLFSGNKHHGIRLRNSMDVRIQDNFSIANGLTGIYGVARDLSATDRDFVEDPYTQALSMTVVGGQLSGNGSGPINVDSPTKVTFANIDLRTPQRALGYRLGGVMQPFQIEFLDIIFNKHEAAVLQRRKETAASAKTAQ